MISNQRLAEKCEQWVQKITVMRCAAGRPMRDSEMIHLGEFDSGVLAGLLAVVGHRLLRVEELEETPKVD